MPEPGPASGARVRAGPCLPAIRPRRRHRAPGYAPTLPLVRRAEARSGTRSVSRDRSAPSPRPASGRRARICWLPCGSAGPSATIPKPAARNSRYVGSPWPGVVDKREERDSLSPGHVSHGIKEVVQSINSKASADLNQAPRSDGGEWQDDEIQAPAGSGCRCHCPAGRARAGPRVAPPRVDDAISSRRWRLDLRVLELVRSLVLRPPKVLSWLDGGVLGRFRVAYSKKFGHPPRTAFGRGGGWLQPPVDGRPLLVSDRAARILPGVNRHPARGLTRCGRSSAGSAQAVELIDEP